MAMNSDFRLSIGFFEHPKIQKLDRVFGDAGVLGWVKVLRFAAQNKPDGRLTGLDCDDIGIAARFNGDAEAFVATLQRFRLLDLDDQGVLCIHDWAEHNPWAAGASKRSEASSKAANGRWEKAKSVAMPAKATVSLVDHTQDADALRDASTRNAPSLSSPNPSFPLPSSLSAAALVSDEGTTNDLDGGADQLTLTAPASLNRGPRPMSEAGLRRVVLPGWDFEQNDLATLAAAGQAMGRPAAEVPELLRQRLTKRRDHTSEMWQAMSGSEVAAWAAAAAEVATKNTGRSGDTGVLAYAGTVIGDHLAGGLDLLNPKVTPLRRGTSTIDQKHAANEAAMGQLDALGYFDTEDRHATS